MRVVPISAFIAIAAAVVIGGGCCKTEDGQLSTWCPTKPVQGGGGGGTLSPYVGSRRLGDPFNCGTCGEERYLYNPLSRTVTVQLREIVTKTNGTTVSDKVSPVSVPANDRVFLGCSERSVLGEVGCTRRYQWVVNSFKAALAPAIASSSATHASFLMAVGATATTTLPDCKSQCANGALTCFSYDSTLERELGVLPAFVSAATKPLRDSAATSLPVADLLKAAGTTVNACGRGDTALTTTTFTNAGAGDLGCAIDYAGGDVSIILPSQVGGARSVDGDGDLVLAFTDAAMAPRFSSRLPLLRSWSGTVSRLVIDETGKRAVANVDNKCVEVTW